jgi:DNA-binding transcriptional LysR family regulator
LRFELTDLRVFVAIAEAGSLTMGASDMHLTAPSASYRLKNLEQTVGVPLFNRTQKGMVLTAAGETMLQHARTILDNVEQLQIGMRRHTDGIEGHIRVHANSSTMCNLPVALSRFLAAYPNVNVDLEEHLSADSVRAVQEATRRYRAGGRRHRPAWPRLHPLWRRRTTVRGAATSSAGHAR